MELVIDNEIVGGRELTGSGLNFLRYNVIDLLKVIKRSTVLVGN